MQPQKDPRARAARYYDFIPNAPDDLMFYRERVLSSETSVLELGCGTGRVLVPLSACCGYIQGVDSSGAMLAICQRKLSEVGIPVSRAKLQLGDITSLEMGQRFDLITAPFRVLQSLDTDEEVGGLFRTIDRHLKPGGRCILNVFKPTSDKETLRREWCQPTETFWCEVPMQGNRARFYEHRRSMDRERMVIYPDLIFREYDGDEMIDETVLGICMRCYYPNEFEQLVTGYGFEIVGQWGGYQGEAYGEGPELVVEFKGRATGASVGRAAR